MAAQRLAFAAIATPELPEEPLETSQRRLERQVRVLVPTRGVFGTGGASAAGGGAAARVPRMGLPQLGQPRPSSSVSLLPHVGQ